jgi:hypothetical protein
MAVRPKADRARPAIDVVEAGGAMERPDWRDATAWAAAERREEEPAAGMAFRAARSLAVRQGRRLRQRRRGAAGDAPGQGAPARAAAAGGACQACLCREPPGADGGRKESGRAAGAKQAAPDGRERQAMRESLEPPAPAALARLQQSAGKPVRQRPTAAVAEQSPLYWPLPVSRRLRRLPPQA